MESESSDSSLQNFAKIPSLAFVFDHAISPLSVKGYHGSEHRYLRSSDGEMNLSDRLHANKPHY
jgi:hypothetical protein